MKKNVRNHNSGSQWLMKIVENPIAKRKIAIENIKRLLEEGESLRVALLLYATDDILKKFKLRRKDLEEEGRTKKIPSPDAFMKKIAKKAKSKFSRGKD